MDDGRRYKIKHRNGKRSGGNECCTNDSTPLLLYTWQPHIVSDEIRPFVNTPYPTNFRQVENMALVHMLGFSNRIHNNIPKTRYNTHYCVCSFDRLEMVEMIRCLRN